MITIEFQPTVSMHFKAGREVFRTAPVGKLFYLILILVAVNSFVFNFLGDQSNSSSVIDNLQSLILVLIPLAVIFVVLPILHYGAVLRSFKANPLASAKRIYEITESGMLNYGEGFNIEITWDKNTRIRMSKQFLFFYIANSVAFFVPRELVSNLDISQIQQWHTNKTNLTR